MFRRLIMIWLVAVIFAGAPGCYALTSKVLIEDLRVKQAHSTADADSLFSALKDGRSENWKQLAERAPDLLLSRDASGAVALHILAFMGACVDMTWVLDHGVPVSVTDRAGWTPLHYAVAADHISAAELLLSRGASVNSRDNQAITPLHAAAGNGSTKMVMTLLGAGADFTMRDGFGKTPRDWAREAGHQNVEALFASASLANDTIALDTPASNRVPSKVATASVVATPPAAQNQISDEKEVVANAEDEALANSVAVEEVESQESAISNTVFSAIRSGDFETVRALCVADPRTLNLRDSTGATPLHVASFLGKETIVTDLLKSGSMVNQRDDFGWTPLHYAAAGNHRDVIETLLRQGADLNACDSSGITPLHAAAGNNSAVASRVLLARGANSSAPDADGRTPIEWAADSGSLQIVKKPDVSSTVSTTEKKKEVVATSKPIEIASAKKIAPAAESPKNEQTALSAQAQDAQKDEIAAAEGALRDSQAVIECADRRVCSIETDGTPVSRGPWISSDDPTLSPAAKRSKYIHISANASIAAASNGEGLTDTSHSSRSSHRHKSAEHVILGLMLLAASHAR
ncbi:MAG: ankyrin repeat domain-containing protein [Candidatus Riflebacteria bacterium]|nr:ankyrin repeat domain-containing protein [Candidatus Riflebacteria bacterium]